jgi:hypothetical protein
MAIRNSHGRSIAERFAVPHAFSPDLTPATAAVAVLGALARIFLGSLLFALWGISSALAWNAIGSHFWRSAALVPLVLGFLLSLAALMMGIASVVRRFSGSR